MGANAFADGTNASAYGADARAIGVNVLALGTGSTAIGNGTTALGAGSSATGIGSTAIGQGAQTWRNNQIVTGTSKDQYQMPGLGQGNNGSWSNNIYQNSGPQRFVTTDSDGTLGTTSFSVEALQDTIRGIGAGSAALSSLPTMTLRDDEPLRCGIGTGTYGGVGAFALGCASQIAKRVYINAGAAFNTGPYFMGNVQARLGFSWGWANPNNNPPKKTASAQNPDGTLVATNSIAENPTGPSIASTTSSLIKAKDAQELEIKKLQQRIYELEQTLRANMSKASVNKENILASPNKKAEEAHNKDVQALKDLINQKEKLEARLEAKFKEQERQLAAQNEILKQQQLQINSMLKLLSSSAPAIKSTGPSNDRMAVPVK